MRVSFIIPLYNCLPLTQAMLASLRATIPTDVAHEIIFIDDGSTDGTRDWLATLRAAPFRVLLNERNLGYAIANNRAAAVARGEFLVLLNSDLVLWPGWLEPMLAAHDSLGARAGVIGNIQLHTATGGVDHAGIFVTRTGKPEHIRARPLRPFAWLQPVREVRAVTGACLLIERALWAQLGGFDEGFVNGGEDVDLCFRARAAGRVNAVALRSVIRHHVSSSPGRKLRDEENSRRLVRRWQREFLSAGDDATRDWCRAHLAAAWANPDALQWRLTLAALAHVLRLRRAPAEAVLGVRAGQAGEFARWDAMFGK